jgi:hypothetical protein
LLIEVIRPEKEEDKRPETPIVLEGTMRIVGDMFRKKLIEILTADAKK